MKKALLRTMCRHDCDSHEPTLVLRKLLVVEFKAAGRQVAAAIALIREALLDGRDIAQAYFEKE